VAVDLTKFDPEDVSAFAEALKDRASDISTKWWTENKDVVSGYLRSLAEAAFQTRLALEVGRIKADDADKIMHMQELAFNQTMQYTKFMTFVLAQRLLNGVFELVGWAIYNRTGVNLFPGLVKPQE
jgi:hypothetical protein